MTKAMKPGQRVNGQIPGRAVAYAQRLYRHGRSPDYIQTRLAGYGYKVKLDTILGWCDEDYARTRRSLNRARRRQASVRTGPGLKLERMKELKHAGLSMNSIRKLMKLDFGTDLTLHQVRYILEGRAVHPLRMLTDNGDRIRAAQTTQEE